jgi:glycosyltransferase involved in cell wall biosynthesis
MIVGVKTTATLTPHGGDHEARYLRKVMNAIRQVQTDTRFVIFTHETNHDAYEGWMRVKLRDRSTGMSAFLPGRSEVEVAAKKAKVEVLLSPLANAEPGIRIPQVFYTLDLIPWEAPELIPEGDRPANLRTVRKACAQARALVVPSEFLRRRCLEMFEAPLDKVLVAPPGLDPVFKQPTDTFVDKPYILIISDALTARSMLTLREALEQIAEEFTCTFVIAGAGSSAEPEDWGIQAVRIEECPDNHLAGLYQNSEVMLYPAVHDGGGQRPLEALYAGTLVVCPRSGAIPEVAKDAPLYYNPDSANSLVQVLRRVLNMEEKERATRIKQGQQCCANYTTWEKAGWKLLTAFKR